jgi:PEP-CTERM motif
LGSNPYSRTTIAWGGEVTYPGPEVFETLSEFGIVGGSSWSDLLDGQGKVTIEYVELIIQGGYIEHGSVSLTNAALIVEGTIVPEPSMLLLFGVGAAYAQMRYRRRFHPV